MAAGPHILVVEDDYTIRESIAELLQDEGFFVRCAANGAEALARLTVEDAPNLILLDLMMPVMDGWSFRQALRQDPRLARIPVIVLSGNALDPGSAALAVDAYLSKPFEVDVLLAEVNRLCDRQGRSLRRGPPSC
jgi:CheY-like chemotaxis protein